MKPTILVLDDDPIIRELLSEDLPRQGFEVLACGTPVKARQILQEKPIQAILLDYRLANGTAVDFLQSIHARFSNIPVIIITNFPNLEQAVDIMKGGAIDYVVKPFKTHEIARRLQKAIETSSLKAEVGYHRRRALPRNGKHELVGKSQSMQEIRRAITEVSQSPSTPVLITGETGTGKEVVARLIHQETFGESRPFVEVDFATIPRERFENELFGQEQGAFPGANQAREGILEFGSEGTIFLDEVVELDLDLQSRLLRVIETRQFRRMGGERPIAFNARIIAATRRNLPDLIQKGMFRPELYYRLAVYEIPIPPLRRRREDIPPLAEYFLLEASARHRKKIRKFSSRFLEKIESHDFPGNGRELKNWVEQAVIQCEGGEADFIERTPLMETGKTSLPSSVSIPTSPMSLFDQQKALIEEALRANKGNKSAAARQLGISRAALLRRISKIKGESGLVKG